MRWRLAANLEEFLIYYPVDGKTVLRMLTLQVAFAAVMLVATLPAARATVLTGESMWTNAVAGNTWHFSGKGTDTSAWSPPGLQTRYGFREALALSAAVGETKTFRTRTSVHNNVRITASSITGAALDIHLTLVDIGRDDTIFDFGLLEMWKDLQINPGPLTKESESNEVILVGTITKTDSAVGHAPEPGTLGLFALGLVGLALAGWRKKRKRIARKGLP